MRDPLRSSVVLACVCAAALVAGCSDDGSNTKDSGGLGVPTDSVAPFETDSAGATDTAGGNDGAQADAAGDSGDSDGAPDGATDDAADDASADTTPSDVSTSCPGGAGCSCSGDNECDAQICIDTPDGKRCPGPCGDGCATGSSCLEVKVGGATTPICAPTWGKLCQPCNATQDCSAAGVVGALCVDQGPLGRFCGAACEQDIDCPEGYECLVGQSPEGPKAKQCIKPPAAGSSEAFGVCSCTQASKAAGASTACYGEQHDLAGKVVGKCPGVRICAPTGLGACILTAPKAEVCDGIDNDCNGQIDEQAGGCAVDESCVAGKCTKSCTAVDGGWTDWAWGACSVGCGGGKRTGTRTCTNPAPSCGGKACVGDASATEDCNTQSCGGSGSELSKGKTAYSTAEQVVSGTIPAGVSVATVQLWGGGGGGGAPGTGGGGAYVHATLQVKAGDTLELRVAGGGAAPGGGGGMSMVTLNGNVVLVAGGGGGAGVDGCSGCQGNASAGAGGGGGAIGGIGQDGGDNNAYQTNSGGGKGGGQIAGGLGGVQSNKSAYTGCETQGFAGAAKVGGRCAGGSQCKEGAQAIEEKGGLACTGNGTGGAGGAGWYGGGSGSSKYTYSGGGGGGGSSWAAASGVTVVDSAGGTLATPGGTAAAGYAGDAGKGGDSQIKGGTAKFTAGSPGLVILSL